MPKVASVRLGWVRSPSSDVAKVTVLVVNDGAQTSVDVGPEVQSITVDVEATKSLQFSVITFDSENLQSTSDIYSFTLGDLEAPAPATGLFHEILAVRDAPDPAPAPAPVPVATA